MHTSIRFLMNDCPSVDKVSDEVEVAVETTGNELIVGHGLDTKVGHGLEGLSYKSYLRAVSCAIVNMLPMPWRGLSGSSKCVLLGRPYELSTALGSAEFEHDFCSHLLMTYRYDFEALGSFAGNETRFLAGLFSRRPRSIESDAGWGCMVRVFQMALLQVFNRLVVGDRWLRPTKRVLMRAALLGSRSPTPRLEQSASLAERMLSALTASERRVLYPWFLVPILRLTLDVSSAPLSLHRIVKTGQVVLGIQPGQWFGPTSCARAVTHLINGNKNESCNLPTTEGEESQQPLRLRAFDGNIFTLTSVHSDNGEIDIAQVSY